MAESEDGVPPPIDPEEEGRHANTTTVIRLASVAALGGFLFGYDTAVINGAVDAIQTEFDVEALELGFAVASALLGSAVGAITAGRVADRLGRLQAMYLAAVLFFVSAIGSGLAPSLEILVVFRIIGGLGVGIASVVAPAYIAEIAPANIRGRLGSLQQLAIVSGIFIALLVDLVLAGIAGSAGDELFLGLEAWRWMFIAMVIPALGYGVGALTIPESPRYLVAEKRDDEARTVLNTVLGGIDVDKKLDQIKHTLRTQTKPKMSDLRGKAAGLRPIVWVGIGLSVFQQFVGINVIFYYSASLWTSVGFAEDDALALSAITGVVNILTTLVAIALVDKRGRKYLLIIGSVGMTISLLVMAIMFGTAPTNAENEPVLGSIAGPVALVAANLFVVFFGMSWGPVVWVLLGESFPNQIRAAALSVAAAAQWIANWVITVTFPPLSEISLALAYGIYTACSFLSLLFVLRFVRETKGEELETMTDQIRVTAGH